MQMVAQAWLVLDLSNSPFYLGLDGFASTIPLAFFAFWGGVVADRFERRRALIITQWIMFGLALLLGVLAQSGILRVWHIIAISFMSGLNQAFAWPLYQTVVANIVRREHLSNAIALNSTQFNLARMFGPLLGALSLHHLGAAGCFYANALSFLAVIGVLHSIQLPTNRRPTDLPKGGFWRTFREGLQFMVSTPRLFWLLLTLALLTILGVPIMMLMPVFARDVLLIGSSGLGLLIGVLGAGAVMGGLRVAFLGDFPGRERFVINNAFVFALSLMVFSLSRHLILSVVALFILGYAMVCFASLINTIIQSAAPEELRGRAMSAFVFAFGGCLPIGNLLAGVLAQHLGAPYALFLQALVLGAFVLYVRNSQMAVLDAV
jgi:MFS family permease